MNVGIRVYKPKQSDVLIIRTGDVIDAVVATVEMTVKTITTDFAGSYRRVGFACVVEVGCLFEVHVRSLELLVVDEFGQYVHVVSRRDEERAGHSAFSIPSILYGEDSGVFASVVVDTP